MYLCDVKDLEKEARKKERKEKILNKVNDVKDWVYDNRQIIMMAAPTVLAMTAKCIQGAQRNTRVRLERDNKELYCYDRSLGHYWSLRRKLTNREWVEIDKRKKNGERMADILEEMRVLK